MPWSRPASDLGPDFGPVATVPPLPGAYALMIRLDGPQRLALARLGNPVLAPGWYVYAGSARGPGGMAARVARHLKRPKAVHWHVDHLTAVAERIDVWAFADGGECALVDALSGRAGATFPVPGFGSSDCRHCRAHLVAIRDKAVADRILEGQSVRRFDA